MGTPGQGGAAQPAASDAPLQLKLLGAAGVVSRHPLSTRPFQIGRGPVNDLIVLDDASSSRHARVWLNGGRAWVADCDSRNGTWVNGERIDAPSPLVPGDEVRIDAGVVLRVRQAVDDSGAVPRLEDVDSRELYSFASDRLVLADSPQADVRVEGATRAVTLLVEPDGAVWRGEADALHPLPVGEEFAVGRRHALPLSRGTVGRAARVRGDRGWRAGRGPPGRRGSAGASGSDPPFNPPGSAPRCRRRAP